MRFIFVLSCILTSVGHVAHSQEPPKAPWGLDPQSTTPISVPADIRRAWALDLEYDEADPIKGVAVDLNADGVEEYLLQSAPSLCGSGGCIYVLFDGASGRKIGQFFGSPLIVGPERVHDYPNITTYSHQGVGSGTYADYSFDGNVYVVTSTRSVEGARMERLLETLRSVPIWRPRP